ncbi:hypothetical protein D3C81_2196600 [compost metagenome]
MRSYGLYHFQQLVGNFIQHSNLFLENYFILDGVSGSKSSDYISFIIHNRNADSVDWKAIHF